MNHARAAERQERGQHATPRPCPRARRRRAAERPAREQRRAATPRAPARVGVVRAVEHRERRARRRPRSGPARSTASAASRIASSRTGDPAPGEVALGGEPREREVAPLEGGRQAARAASSSGATLHNPRPLLARDRTRRRSSTRARGRHRARASPRDGGRRASPSAMSCTVGPSQRVCSRPTFVSTVTADVEHARRVVAPAEAGLDDGDLDLALGELPRRRRP